MTEIPSESNLTDKIKRHNYYLKYKEKRAEQYRENKRQLQYYYDNKDEILKKRDKEENRKANAKFYEKHKERILAEAKERPKIKIECECGGKYTISNKSRHLLSIKHLKHEETKALRNDTI